MYENIRSRERSPQDGQGGHEASLRRGCLSQGLKEVQGFSPAGGSLRARLVPRP